MMSLQLIQQVSRDAAVKAAKQNKVPFTVEAEDLAAWRKGWLGGTARQKPFPFPFLGDYVPDGWRCTERTSLFVDSSGWGRDGEAALSIRQLLMGPGGLSVGKAYAIIEAGQFQLHLGEYEKVQP